MILTDEEAPVKRCCGPKECGIKRDGNRWCIGSACMAWRWAEPAKRTYRVWKDTGKRVDPGTTAPIEAVRYEQEENLSRAGYCGLAGKPE